MLPVPLSIARKIIILKYSFQIKNTKNGLTYEPIARESVLSVEAAARAKVPSVCPLPALHVLSLMQIPELAVSDS